MGILSLRSTIDISRCRSLEPHFTQLDRGRRLMEVIKQRIYAPIPVAKQVGIIYAGVNGFLDDIPLAKISKFEKELFDAFDSSYVDFVKLLEREKALTDEVKNALEYLLTEFKEKFKT